MSRSRSPPSDPGPDRSDICPVSITTDLGCCSLDPCGVHGIKCQYYTPYPGPITRFRVRRSCCHSYIAVETWGRFSGVQPFRLCCPGFHSSEVCYTSYASVTQRTRRSVPQRLFSTSLVSMALGVVNICILSNPFHLALQQRAGPVGLLFLSQRRKLHI